MRNHILPLLALALLAAGAAPSPMPLKLPPPDKPSSTDDREVADVLSRASAVALAEVISIVEQNLIPGDGPLEHVVKLRLLQSSGEPPTKIDIIIRGSQMGGRGQPATQRQPPARVPLSPNPLIVGQRYWFAWCSPHELHDKYRNGIIAWWPEDAAPVKILDEAVRTNRYQWHPQYEPVTGRRYGYLIDEKAGTTALRTWKGDVLLWERTLDGKLTQTGVSTRTQFGTQLFSNIEPTASDILLEVYLSEKNTRTYLDFDTGKTAAVNLGYTTERFSLKTGKLAETWKVELYRTGGLSMGAAKDTWNSVTITLWDEQGKPTSEQVFRNENGQLIPIPPSTQP